MMETMKDAAREALSVQDACNLSGVVFAMHQATAIIWQEAHKRALGTEFVNTHPVMILFIDKLCHLAKYDQSGISLIHTYDECHKLADLPD